MRRELKVTSEVEKEKSARKKSTGVPADRSELVAVTPFEAESSVRASVSERGSYLKRENLVFLNSFELFFADSAL